MKENIYQDNNQQGNQKKETAIPAEEETLKFTPVYKMSKSNNRYPKNDNKEEIFAEPSTTLYDNNTELPPATNPPFPNVSMNIGLLLGENELPPPASGGVFSSAIFNNS